MFPLLGTPQCYWVSHIPKHLSKHQWELLPDIDNKTCHCKASKMDFPSPTIKECCYYDHQNPQTQLCCTKNLQVEFCFKTQQNCFGIFKKRCHPNIFLSFLVFIATLRLLWCLLSEGFKICYWHNINLSFSWVNFNEHVSMAHQVLWEAQRSTITSQLSKMLGESLVSIAGVTY